MSCAGKSISAQKTVMAASTYTALTMPEILALSAEKSGFIKTMWRCARMRAGDEGPGWPELALHPVWQERLGINAPFAGNLRNVWLSGESY